MSIFSIVTVRTGSKGLKNKCLRKINRKAVFEYTIEYSLDLNSSMRQEVFTVVSSDSKRIREYCVKNNIYFVERSPVLASDMSRIEDVIYDAYCRVGKNFDYISLLYGNIPTRYPEEFLKAHDFLTQNKAYDAVISMQNVGKNNPAWMFELNEDVLPMKKEEGYRRQDLRQFMVHDGHTVLFRTKHFLEFVKRNLQIKVMHEAFGNKIKPMLNDKLIIDIDTERDFKLAEVLMKERECQ